MDSWELFRRGVIPKQLRILAFRFGKSPQLQGTAHSLVINGYVTTAGSKLWPKNGGVLEQEISTGSNQEHLSRHVLNTKCRLRRKESIQTNKQWYDIEIRHCSCICSFSSGCGLRDQPAVVVTELKLTAREP